MLWSVLYFCQVYCSRHSRLTVGSSDYLTFQSSIYSPTQKRFIMMLLTCNKCGRKRVQLYVCVCVCMCVCLWVVWEHKFFIYRLIVIGRYHHHLPGDEVVKFYRKFFFSRPDEDNSKKTYLGLFPLAGITVPGVIVHSLCISVILPSCDDRYIFYKDIHICMCVTVSMLNSHVLLCEHP